MTATFGPHGGNPLPEAFGIGRVFGVSTDAIVVASPEGSILLWNEAATRLFGYSPEEAIGMNVDRLIPAEFQDAHHNGIKRYQHSGHGPLVDSGRPHEVPALRKDGRRIYIDLTLSRLPHDGQNYALAILRDVTDRVALRERAEADRRRLQDAYESLEAFTYVVGHDLKEPVRGLGAILDELSETPDGPDRAALTTRARDAHENLRRLLDGLLEWSRAVTTPIEPIALRLPEVLADRGCAAQWEHLASERGARITIAPDLPPIYATQELVCRIFGNLITNAIRHNPSPHPHVAIRAGAPGGPGEPVTILVEDDGPGFPAPMLAQRPRVSSRPSTIRGGFGIAIARRAIDRVQGEMHFENRPEGGARVIVRLPRARG